ncbi:MAG: Oxygen-independent coproporphyrinogen-III oxidase-like protein YqeR [Luteibacter sp.]|uniref:radical SAM family heme chaperone HemW n=1 Tax=Luteibacter sp. TaxID=1886636 RepID=UPI00138272C5|nr:radical SAM family heme chaperone HemW [Luteibacter sp.]KAF1007027.1 MAG: Oxygen-independent coproporphyrinogen-III oxidase-like protein YqeR [Luteibacter sp.]
MTLVPPPLSLYVHMPWCVRKCPYCDFNSHGVRGTPEYATYVDVLLADLDADLRDFGDAIGGRKIETVFFGGGTPSLFMPDLIGCFLDGARERLPFARGAEITLETNPGTVEHGRFDGYLAAGVNRISFGVQSFDNDKLHRLGRIHSANEAADAVRQAQDAGIDNINIDLMYALPQQDLAGALHDVDRAVALQPTHISHYQLTLEPNTAFAANPPPLPDDDAAWGIQEACQERLAAAGYGQYEVSAYAQAGRRCAHNLNYWRFGDYLGIGAGAHGKISDATSVRRRWKTRLPAAYLAAAGDAKRIGGDSVVDGDDLPFEYMLNALRLIDGVPMADFTERTGLPHATIEPALAQCLRKGWIDGDAAVLRTTALGQRFLNDVIEAFMEIGPTAE